MGASQRRRSCGTDAPGRRAICDDAGMWGCLLAGILVILLFVLVPLPLWPLLVVGLVVVFVIAAALGLLRGVSRAIFRRR